MSRNRNLKILALSGISLYFLNGIFRKGFLRGKPKILSKTTDTRMQKILANMKLKNSKNTRFLPTFWAHGSYFQMFLLLFWKEVHSRTVNYDKHILKCSDGGEVAIEVFQEPKNGKKLPQDAPVVTLLHTITGNGNDEAEFAKLAYSKGWRAVVLNRRGHTSKLRSPNFNLMGCFKDTKLMIEYVKKLFPNSYIGAVGISAGSGQIVSYIGNQEENGPVRAAVSLCPAYSMDKAFENFDRKSPLLSKYLLNGLKKFFLLRNESLLSNFDRSAFEKTLRSTSVQSFFESHIKFAGFDSFEKYLEESNPMSHYKGNKIPCLVLNALDDPLCVEENIRLDIATEIENFALVLTNYGSHIAYREGIFGQRSFMHCLAMDFLESAKKVEELV